MAITLSEPTAEQQLINLYNAEQRIRVAAPQVSLEADTRYALCLLKLASAVEPSDYPSLKTAVEAITGIQEIQLVIDHQTRAVVPEGRDLAAVIVLGIRMPVAEE